MKLLFTVFNERGRICLVLSTYQVSLVQRDSINEISNECIKLTRQMTRIEANIPFTNLLFEVFLSVCPLRVIFF